MTTTHARSTLQELEDAHANDTQRAYSVGRATLLELYQELRPILDAVPNHGHEGLSRCYPWDAALPAKLAQVEERGFPQLTDQTKLEDLPFRWISVFPVTGSSEGHYVHVDLIWQRGYQEGRVPLFLLKTFGGQAEAIQLAGLICRLLGV